MDQSLTPRPYLHLSLWMQQSMHVLQMPLAELAFFVQEQGDETDTEIEGSSTRSMTQELPSQPSLFDRLMQEARCIFVTKEELEEAESIIGQLDERGFLGAPVDPESRVLKIIQSFDPPGIAAKDVRDSFCIQLRLQGKEGSLAYRIIDEHFDDFVHRRFEALKRTLNCSMASLEHVIETEIVPLNLFPARQFTTAVPALNIPDLTIREEGGVWEVEINTAGLPRHFSNRSLSRMVSERNKLLLKVGRYLIDKQQPFFNGGKLEAIDIQEMAEKLDIHPATAARAISQKYVFCPMGLLPLPHFFTQRVCAKDLIFHLVKQEDKNHPLSDQALSERLNSLGMPCARRTIAKYRRSLKLGSVSQRRTFSDARRRRPLSRLLQSHHLSKITSK